jgi:hypothetical protein
MSIEHESAATAAAFECSLGQNMFAAASLRWPLRVRNDFIGDFDGILESN